MNLGFFRDLMYFNLYFNPYSKNTPIIRFDDQTVPYEATYEPFQGCFYAYCRDDSLRDGSLALGSSCLFPIPVLESLFSK